MMNTSALASSPAGNNTLPSSSAPSAVDENVDFGHSKKRNIGKTAEAEEVRV